MNEKSRLNDILSVRNTLKYKETSTPPCTKATATTWRLSPEIF